MAGGHDDDKSLENPDGRIWIFDRYTRSNDYPD
ncbi:MAG: hypothetical protein ACLU18_11610 [Bacteroides thetaiotaomicron]